MKTIPLPLLLLITAVLSRPDPSDSEKDGDSSRKILGSSVVTSVSVIMDTGNGTQIIDAVGKPVPKPHGASPVASPINLLNPDRYEFFTFNDNGELVKRLMTLEEIQGIIANGDGEDVNYNVAEYLPEKKVNDIVSNVQNVLKEQMVNHKQSAIAKPILDTPDVSNTWSMILPAFFGNTGEEIAPDRLQGGVTADTLVVTDDISTKIKEFEKLTTPLYGGSTSSSSSSSTKPPSSPSTSFTMASFKTTSVTKTSTITSAPPPSPKTTQKTTELPPTSTHYAKITTEQYVESAKPTTTEKVTILKQEPTSEAPLITVAIIADTKYITTNLEESSHSPIVSIVPVEDVLNEKPTTIQIKLTQPEVRTTPVMEEKLRISTKSTEALDVYSTTPSTTPTKGEPTVNIIATTKTIEPSTKTIETTTKTNEFLASTTKQETTSVKTTTTSTQLHGATKLPSLTTKLIETTTTQPTILPNEPTGLTNDQPTEVKILTTQETVPPLTVTTTQKLSLILKPPENEDFSTWSSIKILTPLAVSKEGSTPQSTVAPTTEATKEALKEEVLPSATLSNLTALKSTTPIWIIIKRKPEVAANGQPTGEDLIQKRQPDIDVLNTTQKLQDQEGQSSNGLKGPSTQSDQDRDKFQTIQKVSSTQKVTVTRSTTEIPTTLPIELKNMPIHAHLPLTTTKIYEINTKLSQRLPESTSERLWEIVSESYIPEKLPDSTSEKLSESAPEKLSESTPERLSEVIPEKLLEAPTVIPPESLSEKSNKPEITTENFDATTYTTQPSLIESIQQLLLQTVSNVEDPIVNMDANEKIEDMLMNMKDKPMQDLQNEAATIGSSLETKGENNGTSTDLPTTISADEAAFSDAVSSVLSQIYGLDVSTTIEDLGSTQYVSELTTVPMDRVYFETTTPKVLDEETDGPLEVSNEDKSNSEDGGFNLNGNSENEKLNSGENSKNVTLDSDNENVSSNPIDESSKPFNAEVQLTEQEVNINFESKKNASSPEGSFKPDDEKTKIEETTTLQEKFETSSIPYGEKLTTREATTPSTSKANDTVKETLPDKDNHSWTLVSTISPPNSPSTQSLRPSPTTVAPPIKLPNQPFHGFGLEETTSRLDTDVYQFVELCNELSFGFWSAVTNGISSVRSVFVSPFAATSLLAMVFLGARGATSGEMNEILKLDDMVTFNPHLIFKNVSESIESGKGAGVAVSVIARELYSDRTKGKLLSFYKERAKQFYDGFVEEVNFKEIGDVVRRRTNLIVKKNSGGKIQEYLKDSSIILRPPLAGVSASIFQTDCTPASTEGRDGELHFVVLPSIRQRKLVPIPAAVYRSGFLAGYDPQLDATAAAIGGPDQTVSTIFVVPGQQGIAAPGDGLLRLERQLAETAFKKGSWARLLRSLIPRPGLELQIPRFMHKSIINSTVALQRMGLKDLFSFDKADLRGLNGQAHELHLSDVLQLNTFATCGENRIGDDHHTEIYPATARRSTRRSRKLGFYLPESVFAMEMGMDDEPRDYQRSFDDPLHDPDLLTLPLPLRPRQARLPDAPRLRFDRPFLFFVRHNPTGLILHMGRFNPRLLP